ncbi:MAG: hypothetical protein ABI565_11290 [Vicinamibacteria bacterium]
MTRSSSGWRGPVVLVTALHLLSTAGAWWITDHGEILAVADRFLNTGHLDLQTLGPGWEDWSRIVTARSSTETRFQPLSILALTPFLALDHLMGWRDPGSFRFVHLEGHFFVGLGLVLVGRFIGRQSGSLAVTALSVVLLGLNWPVWMIARRLGPEPVLFALLAAYATGGARSRFWSQVLLPWVHASGPLLGLGALLWQAVDRRSIKDPLVSLPLVGLILGCSSLALLWNLPVHGHLLMGGYQAFATDRFFDLRNPLVGALEQLGPMVAWTLPLWFLTVKGGRRVILATLALWLPILAFLSFFSTPEPERRLAPGISAWVVIILARMRPLPRRVAIGLAALALTSGVAGLSRDFVDTVETPLGVFSGPILFLLHLAFRTGQPLLAGSIALALLSVACIAGSRTLELLADVASSQDPSDPSAPREVPSGEPGPI